MGKIKKTVRKSSSRETSRLYSKNGR